MTDLIIFAVLFATFTILRTSTFGGPSANELFNMPFALKETLILLTSSFTCSLATYSIFQKKKNQVMFWFAVTIVLGLSFLYLEMTEFSEFVRQGADWQRSGFLSSYFALVGTHGLHICVGLLWMLAALLRIPFRGLLASDVSRIFRLAYFWHFLDVVWIFIFTVVYGIGHLL